MWKDYMFKEYKMPSIISEKMCILINSETFAEYNFYTPADCDKQTESVIEGVPSPYTQILKPILETLIRNPFDKKVKLTENFYLEPNENIKWLDLIRLIRNTNESFYKK
jgi:hypothetical protein